MPPPFCPLRTRAPSRPVSAHSLARRRSRPSASTRPPVREVVFAACRHPPPHTIMAWRRPTSPVFPHLSPLASEGYFGRSRTLPASFFSRRSKDGDVTVSSPVLGPSRFAIDTCTTPAALPTFIVLRPCLFVSFHDPFCVVCPYLASPSSFHPVELSVCTSPSIQSTKEKSLSLLSHLYRITPLINQPAPLFPIHLPIYPFSFSSSLSFPLWVPSVDVSVYLVYEYRGFTENRIYAKGPFGVLSYSTIW